MVRRAGSCTGVAERRMGAHDAATSAAALASARRSIVISDMCHRRKLGVQLLQVRCEATHDAAVDPGAREHTQRRRLHDSAPTRDERVPQEVVLADLGGRAPAPDGPIGTRRDTDVRSVDVRMVVAVEAVRGGERIEQARFGGVGVEPHDPSDCVDRPRHRGLQPEPGRWDDTVRIGVGDPSGRGVATQLRQTPVDGGRPGGAGAAPGAPRSPRAGTTYTLTVSGDLAVESVQLSAATTTVTSLPTHRAARSMDSMQAATLVASLRAGTATRIWRLSTMVPFVVHGLQAQFDVRTRSARCETLDASTVERTGRLG